MSSQATVSKTSCLMPSFEPLIKLLGFRCLFFTPANTLHFSSRSVYLGSPILGRTDAFTAHLAIMLHSTFSLASSNRFLALLLLS